MQIHEVLGSRQLRELLHQSLVQPQPPHPLGVQDTAHRACVTLNVLQVTRGMCNNQQSSLWYYIVSNKTTRYETINILLVCVKSHTSLVMIT